MTEARPLASLNPTLLARKGGAKPAMRNAASALAVTPEAPVEHDDLGWNDMGHESAGHESAGQGSGGEVIAFNPEVTVPEVVRQQRKLAQKIKAERRPAVAAGRRAAFTLRVDAERHLKLRLACAVEGRSAQALVTEALDRLLNDLPEVAQLAAQAAKSRQTS